MKDDFLRDLQLSRAMFDKSKSLLIELCMRTNMFASDDLAITCMEDQESDLKKHLDRDCGIDYHIIERRTGKTLELAWRAESCPLSLYPKDGVYNAFSIRIERNNRLNSAEHCEYRKRTDAIAQDLAYPKHQAQVIFDPYKDNSILSIALAKTADIYEAHNKWGLWRLCNPKKERIVTFHDVSWKLMKEYGYSVYDWYRDDLCKPTKYLERMANQYYFIKDKEEAV